MQFISTSNTHTRTHNTYPIRITTIDINFQLQRRVRPILVHNTTLTMTLDVDTEADADANDDVVPFAKFLRERHETLVSTCLDTRALSAC